MLFRAIALSVALLVSIGTIIPFMTDYTEAGPKYSKKQKKRKLKKYSKAWWRAYHKKQRINRAIAARKRALRARQIILARKNKVENGNSEQMAAATKADGKKGKSTAKVVAVDNSPAILPSGEAAPQTWKRGETNNSELQFRVNDEGGNELGTASLTVVGNAAGPDSDSGRNKTLGGVSTSALRRTVIDKMVKEEGWVVNDYQKVINGKKVYVVVAQSAVRGAIKSRLFYFTEVDGRIYSLATNSSSESAEKIAQDSERVINSLQRSTRPTQAELR